METTYTRIRVLFAALDRLHNCNNWVANLSNIAKPSSHKVELAVSWWSIGTVDTDHAREAARQLEVVSKVADTVNALNLRWGLKWDKEDDKYIYDEDSFELYTEVIADAIQNKSYTAIESFFKLSNYKDGDLKHFPELHRTIWRLEEEETGKEWTFDRYLKDEAGDWYEIWTDYEGDYRWDISEEEDDDEEYTPSATHGDYSPSCPWNAPGMSISDFI